MRQLYTYYRSSAAYRVRIALQLKGLSYDSVPIHLLRAGGEQHTAAYRALNPQGLVPTWVETAAVAPAAQEQHFAPLVLSQSLAIIEFLDEAYPNAAALLPRDSIGRARVRSLALMIACDIHPLNNLRVLHYLSHTLGISATQKEQWIAHWIGQGLAAVETQLAQHPASGPFCHGNSPSLADCCLIPQVFNAQRYGCALEAYPTILSIAAHCNALAAFRRAAPAQQSDFEA